MTYQYLDEDNIILVPDTSAVIEGIISKLIDEENLNYPEIIIPEAVVAELEYQANKNRPTGLIGLEELKKLQKMSEEGIIAISFSGKRPTNYEISLAKTGEIDAMIRDVAKENLGCLITSDKIQAKSAEAIGILVKYYKQEFKGNKPLSISDYFDDLTMSVHLKENVVPMAKVGLPGHIELKRLSDEKIKYKDLEILTEEILEKERYDSKTYLEADMDGAMVVQSGEYRISVAIPPFSEAMEITAVRPVANVSLNDYRLSDKLMDRLKNNAEGILISGSPGAGKSTFAQAVAEFYNENNKIVKTMETPRDLQVSDEITQYSPLEGDMEKTADILLLVRPDFTIYDELRKSYDFQIFADMRLAGVGMIGVVHATRPIDGIQRIANRIELGVIPSVVDTTIYIEDGEVKAVYENRLTIKVPTGMVESDLARPVIEVRDFETGELKNEIYTYGEQTIVMDIDLIDNFDDVKREKSAVEKIAEKEIKRKLKKYLPRANIKIDLINLDRVNIYISEEYIPKIIGKNGKRIAEIEKDIGISIGVDPIESLIKKEPFLLDYYISKKHIIFEFSEEEIGSSYDIMVNGNYLFTATVGKSAEVKIRKSIDVGKRILEADEYGFPVTGIYREN
ncbi:PINc/VapC family ATPase [uncultured Methanobrevibacter sp.]|uniref:PINc/VapC family ATPase n=1 Tax=uncultured Methanobrevibacter sp. TaxID=253161 RepID=UPI0025E7ED9D|nr:PINc/VapC family ATPase [uncultured Methanobrevibacter sp.]